MKNKKAFSLIEVMIAVLIITILAAGMFSAFTAPQYLFYRARHRLQAFNFAREALDRLRSENHAYDDIDSTYLDNNIGTIAKGEMLNLNTAFTYDVTEVAGAYKQITITVNWTEAFD